MVAAVDICNLALGRAGSKQRLTSLSDTGVLAAHCNALYSQTRDALLQQYDWPWAERISALALSVDEVPGWDYVYQKPTDCLTLRAVCDEAGARAWAVPLSTTSRVMQPLPRQPYRLFYGTDGSLIGTDVEDAYGVMTWRVTDTVRFPPLFVSALAWAIAVDLAALLQANKLTTQLALEMASRSAAEAAAASGNEEGSDQAPESPAVTARG